MFKVKITQGSGYSDLDKENEQGEDHPTFREFKTHAERAAYLIGVNDAYEAMDGYVDAWVSAEPTD